MEELTPSHASIEVTLMHYVYILQCADTTLYTGRTNDLERRVHAHNTSKGGAKYTRARRPVVLVYHERFRTLSHALQREYEIKQLTRTEKIHLIATKNAHFCRSAEPLLFS